MYLPVSHSQNQVMLLEGDVRLKGTRLEAAEQSLAADRARHPEEAGSLQEQLRSEQSGRAAAQSDALAARAEAGEAAAARGAAKAALRQLQQQHAALQAEHANLKHQVIRAGRPKGDQRAHAGSGRSRLLS
jgi:transketolase